MSGTNYSSRTGNLESGIVPESEDSILDFTYSDINRLWAKDAKVNNSMTMARKLWLAMRRDFAHHVVLPEVGKYLPGFLFDWTVAYREGNSMSKELYVRIWKKWFDTNTTVSYKTKMELWDFHSRRFARYDQRPQPTLSGLGKRKADEEADNDSDRPTKKSRYQQDSARDDGSSVAAGAATMTGAIDPLWERNLQTFCMQYHTHLLSDRRCLGSAFLRERLAMDLVPDNDVKTMFICLTVAATESKEVKQDEVQDED